MTKIYLKRYNLKQIHKGKERRRKKKKEVESLVKYKAEPRKS